MCGPKGFRVRASRWPRFPLGPFCRDAFVIHIPGINSMANARPEMMRAELYHQSCGLSTSPLRTDCREVSQLLLKHTGEVTAWG